MASRRERMSLSQDNGHMIINMGPVEIWDGADLALLRDTFTRQCDHNRCRALGVDMSTVKYIPSGFFGMLFDWHERGVAIRLYSPQDRVMNMLWFRQFFELETNGSYVLQSEPKELLAFDDDSCEWDEEETWVEGPESEVAEVVHK